MKSRLEQLATVLEGLAVAVAAAAATGVVNYLQQNANYTEVDWSNIKQVAAVGALAGLSAWLRPSPLGK